MIVHKQQQNFPQSSQAGFTIIESLIAIIVVTILLVGLSPIIVLSTAVRVQARRVERATEAAQTYIDAVRSQTIPDPAPVGTPFSTTTGSPIPPFDNAPVPSGTTLTCPQNGQPYTQGGQSYLLQYCTSPSNVSVFCVHLDDTNPGSVGCSPNSPKDLIVQGFRTDTPPLGNGNGGNSADQGYRLGVRVYRADAFSDATPLKASSQGNTLTQSATRGTLGDRKAPLVEMTTDIAPRGNFQDSLSDWCDRLRPTQTNTNSTCH